MRFFQKRSIFALTAGVAAAATGAIYLRLRRRPVEIPLPETVTAEAPLRTASIIETTAEPTLSLPPIMVLISAAGGLACLIAAQNFMLRSAWPLTPLALYTVGLPLLIPLLIYWRHEWAKDVVAPLPDTSSASDSLSRTNRRLYVMGIGFFTLLNIALSQTGMLSPLLIFAWLMNIALVMNSIGLLKRPSLSNITKWLRTHRLEIVGVIGLMVITAWAYGRIPSPFIPLSLEAVSSSTLPLTYNDDAGALYHYLIALFTHDVSDPRNLSTAFALLLIPSAYLLAQTIGIKIIGILAALLVAIAEWTLALGQSGGVYPALAVCGAVFLFTLLRAMRNGVGYGWSGFTLGFGWLISPLFIVMGLLIPIAVLLEWQIEHKPLRRLLINFIIGLVIAGCVVLPFAIAPRPIIPPPAERPYTTGLSTTTLFVEGLSRSLLMFNLAGDPNIQHGLPNRPVFAPALAAAFVVGCLLWAMRLESRSHTTDWLFIIALVVSLIPSVLVVDQLANAPDLQRAALALPIAITLAAIGMNGLVRLLPKLKTT
ncbi:MAG: hypothetical protein K8L97_13910 [Anaerolineae bacterium]|nr:hypothetical protein [Anaerolineae bacterium]